MKRLLAAGVFFAFAAGAAQDPFLIAAQAANIGAARIGTLAGRKGCTADIRALGKRIAAAHTEASRELRRRAAIRVATARGPEYRATYARLESASCPAFDRIFMEFVNGRHESDVALFRREAARGSSPAMQEYAQAVLPSIEIRTGGADRLAPDMRFVVRAWEVARGQQELGRFAAARASSEPVRRLGTELAETFSESEQNLRAVVDGSLAMEVRNPVNAAERDRLAALSGRRFDREYLRFTVEQLQAAIPLFEEEAEHGADEGLRQYAARQLPAMRQAIGRIAEARNR